MTRRSTWTPRRKLTLFETHKGICHICRQKIDGVRETWDVEHIIPLAMGGADDETNCAPAHTACHKDKTATDKGQIAKCNRVRAKHFGAGKKPKSRFKKRVDGTVVDRETGKPI